MPAAGTPALFQGGTHDEHWRAGIDCKRHFACLVVVVGCGVASVLFAVGGNDDVLEVPRLQGADHEQQAREMSRLRTWNVREGLDETHTPLVTPTPLPDVPPSWVVPDTEPRTVEAVICSYSWDCDTAVRIARCESGDDLHAEPWENWYHRGPFQVSYIHAWRYAERGWDWGTASDEQHVAIAYEIQQEQGWTPWACW